MTSSEGWTPLREPRRSESSSNQARPEPHPHGLGDGLRVTAFTHLARVQALSSMGDGLVAVALAGSIFFSIDPSDARWRVALYLVLTIAPFAVVTPVLGPAIDRARGGRRGMVIGSLAGRAIVAFFMISHIDSVLLFPEAFLLLVLQKAYFVSRTALVPGVCPREEELIEANSKLALLSAFSGVAGGALGVILIFLLGGGGATGMAVIIFFAGALTAVRLPQAQVAAEPADITEKLEVRGANIILAATALGVVRAIVGFTTFLLAFHLRAGEDGIDRTRPGSAAGAALGTIRGIDVDGTPGPPSWHFGVAGLAVGVGAFLGARYAPRLREATSEEKIVLGALLTVGTTSFLGAWGGGIAGIALLAFGVGISAAVAKLGFDALVQRDAPKANHGRAFARFEGRFQSMWAIGSFIPVVIPIGIRAGALLIALAAFFAAGSYHLGLRTDRVQRSSRVREAIRDRVPDSAVEKLRLTPLLGKLGPRLSKMRKSSSVDPPEESLDPTLVAPRAVVAEDSLPVDQVRWGPNAEPHLSSGDEVWVSPSDAAGDPTVEAKPEPGEDGQYRLWE